jgi:hypothetical protein
MILALLLAGQAVPFDPIRFFAGRTHGDGQLKEILKSTHDVKVDSLGRVDRTGMLTLTQRIAEEGQAPRIRYWRLRRAGPNRYVGTLTDATGPVAAWMDGASLHIKYRMKGGLDVDQYLTPMPSGRAVDNRMTVRKLGVVVANMREYIFKR